MADNTLINPGSALGDTIRTIQRSSGTKTEVVQSDFGGEGGPESLVSVTNPLPVQDPYNQLTATIQAQAVLAAQAAAVGGFYPFELPTFLLGVGG